MLNRLPIPSMSLRSERRVWLGMVLFVTNLTTINCYLESELKPVLCKVRASSTHFIPTVIFVAGVEGSGHHALLPMLHLHPQINFIKNAEQHITDFWDPTVPRIRRIELRSLIHTEIQREFDECVDNSSTPAIAREGCSQWVLYGLNTMLSYPYDSPRGTLRHPDLIELIDLVEDPVLRPRFDLKILVLHRPPFETVRSSLRRHFVTTKICQREVNRGKRTLWDGRCDAMIYLARETEMSLTFLSAELAALSPEYFRILDFTTMITRPTLYATLLSNFLNLDTTGARALENIMSAHFTGPVSHTNLGSHMPETDEYLHALFSNRRSIRWQLIASGRFELEFMHNATTSLSMQNRETTISNTHAREEGEGDTREDDTHTVSDIANVTPRLNLSDFGLTCWNS
eukprot:m.14460 g.14460  ORF g.14460 m.14460 type:complete len:401 (+) comp10146_c0_seq1:103-1305(+)